jgi:GH18 family chitinase
VTETFDLCYAVARFPSPNAASSARVVCYLESWAAHRREPMKFFTKEFDPFACTHLIYAYASLDPHSLKIVPQDEEFDIVKGN